MFLHSKFSMGAIRIGSIITGSSDTKLHSQSICNPSSSPLLNTQAKHWSTSPLPYVHHQIVKSPCMCHHHLRHSKIIFLNLNHNRGPHTTWYAFLSLFPLHVRQFLVTRELCHWQWSQLHSPIMVTQVSSLPPLYMPYLLNQEILFNCQDQVVGQSG